MSNAVSTTGTLVARKSLSAVILTSSVAAASVITTQKPHGLTTGVPTTIAAHAGSTPAINGVQVPTVLTPTTFSIPVNVTVGGTGGTVVENAYVTVGELTKITPPGKSRNKIETSTHNDGTESSILGMLRQKDGAFTINYLAGDNTHRAINNDIDLNIKASWRFTFPSGIVLTGPGHVQQFQIVDAPVDAAQQADVVLAWSGPIIQT
jgi:hypothetical protein